MTGVGELQGGRRHGMSLEAIEAMRDAQDNGCAVCGSDLPLVPQVDHDHVQALIDGHPANVGCRRCVRALLCGNCNSMLGHAKDSPERLEAGAEYIRRWKALLRVR